MQLVNRYPYHTLKRITRTDGVRHYVDPDSGAMLPSVTTVLDATANKVWLEQWYKRVGKAKALEITAESAALGSLMHQHLEQYTLGQPRPRGNPYLRDRALLMSNTIIEQGLSHVSEVWGSEITLHAPGLYAGTTDLVGLYDGVPAVIDFKSARTMKPRSSDKVKDYFAQICAYTLAHNYYFETDIRTCVILMVNHTGKMVTFKLDGADFIRSINRWEQRMTAYHHRVPQKLKVNP